MKPITAISCGLAASLASASAWAGGDVEGVVTAVDGADLYLDIGDARGAEDGAVVELWRTVRTIHPVTRAVVSDRFRIGTLKLAQVRPKLSLGHVDGKPDHPPMVGDVVILHRSGGGDASGLGPPATTLKETKPKKEPPPKEPPAKPSTPEAPPVPLPVPPTNAPPSQRTEADDVADLVRGVSGDGIAPRILAYERYARAHPSSPYARSLLEEAQALRQLLKPAGEAPAVAAGAKPLFEPPSAGALGAPMDLAIGLDPKVQGAILHHRNAGDTTYASITMNRAGPGYFQGRIPKLSGRAAEYFIEAVDAKGNSEAVVGSAPEPKAFAVRDMGVHPTRDPNIYSAAVLTDYAVFNLKRNNDTTFQTEGTFGVRFRDEGLRALRTGFGVYRGKGGSLDELDVQGLSGRSVGLTYGHLEGEYAFTDSFSAIARAIVGLGDRGVSPGAQGFVRIGSDRKTNLSLGGEVLGLVGLRGIVQLEWNTIPNVPIVLRSEVTNQPAGSSASPDPTQSTRSGEVGARAIVQAGYRWPFHLTTSVRLSYQGRTINHAGPGAGAAVSYEW